eukprot:764948-Hanusia_phi.AAC.6
MAYWLRLMESFEHADPSAISHLGDFSNQLWLITVSLTGVGYGISAFPTMALSHTAITAGDSVAVTHLGRFVSAISFIMGFVISSMMLTVFTRFVRLGKTEERCADVFVRNFRMLLGQKAAQKYIIAWYMLQGAGD